MALFIEMTVTKLLVDPVTDMPMVVLSDKRGRELPIWIGVAEATAIAAEMEKIVLERPMTHDLMKSLVEACSAKLERVEITAVKEGTYFSILRLIDGSAEHVLDCRPSDGIALALRMRRPIHVAKKVLDQMASEHDENAVE